MNDDKSEYDFLTEEKRFYHIAKSLNFSVIKDQNTKSVVQSLFNMLQILKELVANERRSAQRGNRDE